MKPPRGFVRHGKRCRLPVTFAEPMAERIAAVAEMEQVSAAEWVRRVVEARMLDAEVRRE